MKLKFRQKTEIRFALRFLEFHHGQNEELIPEHQRVHETNGEHVQGLRKEFRRRIQIRESRFGRQVGLFKSDQIMSILLTSLYLGMISPTSYEVTEPARSLLRRGERER